MTEFPPCVGCGHCCLTAQCVIGSLRYGPHAVCPGLIAVDDHYRCRLVVEDPTAAEKLAIGEGCSSTLFNIRRAKILRKIA
jgi:hypothetical protein